MRLSSGILSALVLLLAVGCEPEGSGDVSLGDETNALGAGPEERDEPPSCEDACHARARHAAGACIEEGNDEEACVQRARFRRKVC